MRSLARKLFSATAGPAGAAIGLFIAGQLFLVSAFILPLKILLLAGADGVPAFLAAWVTPAQMPWLIYSLAVAAIMSYLLHLASEKGSRTAIERGAADLVARARKLALFDQQDELAKNAYAAFSRIAGSTFLILFFFSLLLLLNPLLFALVLAALIASILLTYGMADSASALGRYTRRLLRYELGRFLSVISAGLFLLAFALILWQMLDDRLDNALVAMVCLLLLRQTTNRLSGLVRDAATLATQRHRINALFFTHLRFEETVAPHRRPGSFFELLHPDQRARWLGDLLATRSGLFKAADKALGTAPPGDLDCLTSYGTSSEGVPEKPVMSDAPSRQIGKCLASGDSRCEPEVGVDTQWIDSGTPGLALLRARFDPRGKAGPVEYFVKLFERNHRRAAMHERMLFETMPDLAMAPGYLGHESVRDCELLLFEALPTARPAPADWNRLLVAAHRELLARPPDERLLDRARRTHPGFHQSLTSEQVDLIALGAQNEQELQQARRFVAALPGLRQRLACLPLALRNPAMTPAHAWQHLSGDLVFSRWEHWRLEPAGTGCPDWMFDGDAGQALMREIGARRPVFQSVKTRDLTLCAKLSWLPPLIQAQDFAQALRLATQILDLINPEHG